MHTMRSIINVPRWIVPFVAIVIAALFSTADALVGVTEHESTESSEVPHTPPLRNFQCTCARWQHRCTCIRT